MGYIDGMEDKLAADDGGNERNPFEVGKLHDKGIRAKCVQLATAAEGKIQQVKAMVSTAKANLISSAGRMVQTFQEKGRCPAPCGEALRIPRRSLTHGTRIFSCRQGDGAVRWKAGCVPGGAAPGGSHMKKRRARPCRQRSTAGPGAGGRQGRACQAAGLFLSCGKTFSGWRRRGPSG